MLNPSNNPPEQQHYRPPLKQFIQKHSLASCVGLWVTLVLVGSMATVGLFNPGPIEQEASNPTPSLETVQESTPQSTAKKDLPLSLFGAIALGCLGCAAGSWLLTYALRDTIQPRPSPRRLKPVKTVRKKRRVSSQQSHPVSGTPQPKPSTLTLQAPIDRRLTTKTQVTVLAPEESHPLDGGEESLADLLDVRKQQSLASLLTISQQR
jgi:hypothetical protein